MKLSFELLICTICIITLSWCIIIKTDMVYISYIFKYSIYISQRNVDKFHNAYPKCMVSNNNISKGGLKNNLPWSLYRRLYFNYC